MLGREVYSLTQSQLRKPQEKVTFWQRTKVRREPCGHLQGKVGQVGEEQV